MPLKQPFDVATKTTPNNEIKWRYFIPGPALDELVQTQMQRAVEEDPALELIARYFMEIKSEFDAEENPVFDEEFGEVVFQFEDDTPPSEDWIRVDTALQTGWVPPQNNPLRLEYQSALAFVNSHSNNQPTLRSLIGDNKFAKDGDPLELNATPRTYLMAGQYYVLIPYVEGKVEFNIPEGLIEISDDEYDEAQMADRAEFYGRWIERLQEIKSRPPVLAH